MDNNYYKPPEFDLNFHGLQIKWIDFNEIESIKLKEFIGNASNNPIANVIHAICHDQNKLHNYHYDVTTMFHEEKRILEIIYKDEPTIPPTWDKSIEWIFIPGKLIIQLGTELTPENIQWIQNNRIKPYKLEEGYEWIHFSG